jgi:molybdenum cofactor guanylyltransferase
METLKANDVTALILAGGKGRRIDGQDKGLIEVAGRPLIEHILEAVTPQVGGVLINANRNSERYSQYGYPVIPDDMSDFQGPLAGIATGMEHASTAYIATLPCDGPFVPDNLVSRLAQALTRYDADIAVAHDGVRLQPVYALLPTCLLNSLKSFLASGERKIDRWFGLHKYVLADFSDHPETFLNVNTPNDLKHIQTLLSEDNKILQNRSDSRL